MPFAAYGTFAHRSCGDKEYPIPAASRFRPLPPSARLTLPPQLWKEREKGTPHRYKSIQSGTCEAVRRFGRRLKGNSFQDALRAFFQPIKTDDTRRDFYTVYKREAIEYDMDYIKKYDEDLNTTLIFVRHPPLALAVYLTCPRRPVCSLLSARRSSSMSNQSFSPTRTINQQPSFAPSFSRSTNPLSRV